ncbi:hypothetical protein CC80DRAFT_571391 [Byssothecium circinans]|uniref:NACHT domain-containing protein n=1 Tax=Byssothecium circinans TaxID=147558 RepID=A0A6A5TMM4_9PLEO|nr:hypothetical protein CC80DRAFT_571391 [Byssothecium circinans]
MNTLGQIKESHKRIEIQGGSKLDDIRNDIMRLAQTKQTSVERQAEVQAAELMSLKTKLAALQKEQITASTQVNLLESFGKSTLMKFIYEDKRTTESLKRWAGQKNLHTASYYFWNQGTDMQKTGVGLFQSLLYQILRSSPDLIIPACTAHLHHELWEMMELKEIFHRIAQQTELDTKYCFFVTGLDEYDGEEKDVIDLLETLSVSKDVKICASSRPGRLYEAILRSRDRKLDVAHFTKEDMQRYVKTHLQKSENWKKLIVGNQGQGQNIINDISARASGVWLWVSLITDDIVKEADKNEDISTLRRIVDDFPDELHGYFERIIRKVPKRHREDMARIFLIAVEALHPLPLYAFALLATERKNVNYAIEASISAIQEKDIEKDYPTLKSRIRNRCSDLLVVDDTGSQVFLGLEVDFLHRTVRDFLRDYDQQLRIHLTNDFNPLVSLCRICLGFLKVYHFRERSSLGKIIIEITDQLLYYAHAVEKRSKPEEESPVVSILDELDRVNSYHARDISNHWTHARDPPSSWGYDHYHEWGQCNFLALTVQARLVKYVRAKLQANPCTINKRGRPLLDYALRPRRVTPTAMPYHSTREDPSLDIDMVNLLLNHKVYPNQPVRLYGGRSVWALFLLSIEEIHNHVGGGTGSTTYQKLNQTWYQTCMALITCKSGARLDCLDNNQGNSNAPSILHRVFGHGRASVLEQEAEKKRNETRPLSGSCIAM